MGRSREQYVISGEMDTSKIQGQGNTQTGKCDFQYFEINWYQNRHGYSDHGKILFGPEIAGSGMTIKKSKLGGNIHTSTSSGYKNVLKWGVD